MRLLLNEELLTRVKELALDEAILITDRYCVSTNDVNSQIGCRVLRISLAQRAPNTGSAHSVPRPRAEYSSNSHHRRLDAELRFRTVWRFPAQDFWSSMLGRGDGNGARRPGHDAGAQAGKVEAVELGMIELGNEHRGHAV